MNSTEAAPTTMSVSSSSSDGDEGATQPDAPAHALTYFSHRAALRCDLTQLLFALSDTPLTIERVLYPEFLQQKATYPGGQLPVLRHGARAVGQSKAIARYAATLGDLYPSDAWDAAEADARVPRPRRCSRDLRNRHRHAW
jgi:hypothetical protein